MKYSDLVEIVSEKLNIPSEVVDRAYKSYWEFIKEKIEDLPLKEDFTPETISQTQLSATGYITSNAKTYLLPYLFSEFSSFAVTKA